ncbi:hypothetical protein Tco_1176449 [Tanacetum coccineum]
MPELAYDYRFGDEEDDTTTSFELISPTEFWSKQRDDVPCYQLQKFWNNLSLQARHELLRLDKQTLFEQARKNMYCSRCNGLLLEAFMQIVTYGKSLQQDGVVGQVPCNGRRTSKTKTVEDASLKVKCDDDIQDPSVHPWGGLTTTRDGVLTVLDCYLCSKSLQGLQNVFTSARARERERECLYPDACGGGVRGWISQGMLGYGRGHGTRETCALHTARLSVDTLVAFWSALGEETRHSLLKMKEEDFMERLMYRINEVDEDSEDDEEVCVVTFMNRRSGSGEGTSKGLPKKPRHKGPIDMFFARKPEDIKQKFDWFDNKRFCRDCRKNVVREFKELKELKRMRKETRCTTWFCGADTSFQYEVTRDTIQVDWHQMYADSAGIYHHYEWGVGTGEGKSDIREFENVGLKVRAQVKGLDLAGLNACYITLRAWKKDGRCNEQSVKAHALKGQQCVHCRLVVGDSFVTITRGEGMREFFEHAEEAEEEEECNSGQAAEVFSFHPLWFTHLRDDDSMDNDGNDLDGECSRPQKHAKSPELAREFLLDAATVIFKEQVEKAFREGTARQNAHSMFVSFALKLLEERVLVAWKDIITLENQVKLLEEEEKEKRDEEERKERRRAKEKEKKLRRKERLRNKEKERENCQNNQVIAVSIPREEELTTSIDESNSSDTINSLCKEEEEETVLSMPASEDYIQDEQNSDHDSNWNAEENVSYASDYSKHSRRKPKLFCDQSSKWSDRGRFAVVSESGGMVSKPDPRIHSDGFETSSRGNRLNRPLRSNNPRTNVRSNGSRYGERSHCSHNRSIDSYDPHACNCYQHNDYRAKEGNPERDTEVSKPYYRENKFNNQTEYVCDNYIRPKSNVTKKTWEPIESKKVGPVKHIDPLNGKSSVTTNHEHSDMKESENTVEIEVDTLSGTTDLSTSSNSSSDSCSSCLSEGDGGTSFSSSTQNPDSSSTSDSEDASHHSEVIKESPQNTKEDETLTEVSSGELPSKKAQFHENSPPQVNVVVPPLPAQGIHFPVYQAPSLGYYHPAPVPWVATAANGLMPVPHPNHYLFPSPFGYGLNGNSHFLHYGARNLQPLGPPLFDHGQQLMYQSVPHVNGNIKDHTKIPVLQKGEQTENSEKAPKSNTGFSLFHFGGPVAHSNGSIDVDATLSSKGLGDTIDGGAHACAKDVVEAEQYNLFSANNGIRGQGETLVGQGSACNRGCGHRSPSAYVLQKYFVCVRLETSGPQNIKSVLTQKGLDIFCQNFHIPDDVHSQLPSPNQTIHEMLIGKIDVYTRFFEYANFRIPLSTFLVNVLRHYRINLSQLSVIAAAKVSHFEILCRVRGIEPTVGLFRCFYVNSKNKGWKYFSKRLDSNVVCYTKPIDSLKRWNDHFFWETVKKLKEFLTMAIMVREEEKETVKTESGIYTHDKWTTQSNQSEDQRQEESTSHKFHLTVHRGVRLILLDVIAERAQRPRKKREAVTDASGSSHPSKKLRGGYETSGGATSGKSSSVLNELLASSMLNVEVGVAAVATLPLVTSSVSAMPEHENSSHHSSTNASGAEGDFIIMFVVVPPVMTEVVVTSHAVNAPSVPETGTKVTSLVHASMFHDSDSMKTVKADDAGPFYFAKQDLSMGSRELNAETLHQVFVPQWNVLNDPLLDDYDVSREFVDHLAPPALFSQIREMDYHHLFTEFNAGTARQACLNAKVRMRTEYCLSERKRLESECEKQADLLKAKADEVENLKAQLLLKETEAAEAARLSAQVSAAEATEKMHAAEIDALKQRNDLELKDLNVVVSSLRSQKDGLVDQVHALEITCSGLRDQLSGYERLKEQIEEFQDAQMNIVNDKVAKMDTDLLEMALHLEEKFYLHLLTTISGQRWLLTHGMKLAIVKCLNSQKYLSALGAAISRAIEKGMQDGLSSGIVHGKEGRSLADVAAYNPAAEADYNSALQRFREVDFPLLSELSSHKNASVEDIMNLLRLKGPLADALGMSDLQPNVDKLMLLVHRSKDQVVLGETSLSFALSVTHSRVERIRERSALIGVWTPLVDPLSAENLVGAVGTSNSVPATIATTTALSTTFASASFVPSITIEDYEIVGTNGPENAQTSGQGNVASFPTVEFEKEEPNTTSERDLPN